MLGFCYCCCFFAHFIYIKTISIAQATHLNLLLVKLDIYISMFYVCSFAIFLFVFTLFVFMDFCFNSIVTFKSIHMNLIAFFSLLCFDLLFIFNDIFFDGLKIICLILFVTSNIGNNEFFVGKIACVFVPFLKISKLLIISWIHSFRYWRVFSICIYLYFFCCCRIDTEKRRKKK